MGSRGELSAVKMAIPQRRGGPHPFPARDLVGGQIVHTSEIVRLAQPQDQDSPEHLGAFEASSPVDRRHARKSHGAATEQDRSDILQRADEIGSDLQLDLDPGHARLHRPRRAFTTQARTTPPRSGERGRLRAAIPATSHRGSNPQLHQEVRANRGGFLGSQILRHVRQLASPISVCGGYLAGLSAF